MTSASLSDLEGMSTSNPGVLLEVRDLTVGFPSRRGVVLAANHVNLSLSESRTLGLVGESGCGKSVTLRSIIGMVPKPGEVLEGAILWHGNNLVGRSSREIRAVRGRQITMIFQDPGASLNPVYEVGDQISEVFRIKLGLNKKESAERTTELLRSVGIPSPDKRARDYPHQLSGGMRQRVMIAMAVAPGPQLLLADEPTTAVDVTVQEQILSLLVELQQSSGMAVILVSHDLAVIGQTCDEIAVMYAGYVVERGSRDEVINSPRHPYTQALLAAELVFEPGQRRGRLDTIGGQPPDLGDLPSGCPFQPRCRYAAPGVRRGLDDHRSTLAGARLGLSVRGGSNVSTTDTTSPLLVAENISKTFPIRRSLTQVVQRAPRQRLIAVDDVSLSLYRSQVLGIVGESGSGKSTIAYCLVRLLGLDSGKVLIGSEDMHTVRGDALPRPPPAHPTDLPRSVFVLEPAPHSRPGRG